MGGMKGKVASVPGGAGSIGAASVRELVLEGASVAIADILTEEGEALARELGSQVLFSETDLRSDEQIERCVDATVKQFGRIDFLINAAASYHDKGFESSRADWAFTRSEEHTSELQSLMRISYAVFCLKQKNYNTKS